MNIQTISNQVSKMVEFEAAKRAMLPISPETVFGAKAKRCEKECSTEHLIEFFCLGTKGTKTGQWIGMEVETDFLLANGNPIGEKESAMILSASENKPRGCDLKLELGRQKIELNISPSQSFSELYARTLEGLEWLYGIAGNLGAHPLSEPEFKCKNELLWVQEERDEIWINLDGRKALEHLCRCSSVQFTVDVHPDEAIPMINSLFAAQAQKFDYAPNDRLWKLYIKESHAPYDELRYGGPEGFESMEDYVAQMTRHEVVMHKGNPIWLPVSEVEDLDINLYLRSIWWHYRLRRYGNSLVLEIRPQARRSDDQIAKQWQSIATVIGL